MAYLAAGIFVLLLGLQITGAVWMIRKAKRGGQPFPVIALLVYVPLCFVLPIIGPGVTLGIWSSNVDERIRARELKRQQFESTRTQGRRPAGTGWAYEQPTAPAVSVLDSMTREDQAELIDDIIDRVIELYPDHPHSVKLRAERTAQQGTALAGESQP